MVLESEFKQLRTEHDIAGGEARKTLKTMGIYKKLRNETEERALSSMSKNEEFHARLQKVEQGSDSSHPVERAAGFNIL